MNEVPSGKRTKIYGTWPIEIDGIPTNRMGIFQFAMLNYQTDPEAICSYFPTVAHKMSH